MSELTTKEAMLERAVAALEKIKTAMSEINPTGVVQAYAGSTIPDGWLLCDGSAVSRTDYADLYAVIGDTYGDGDGSNTFNLPNLVDKFVEGSATAGTVKSAGLPNIKGSVSPSTNAADAGYISVALLNTDGALYPDGTSTTIYGSAVQTGQSKSYNSVIGLDASRSNNIYGNSTTVQPPAVTMQYIIKY